MSPKRYVITKRQIPVLLAILADHCSPDPHQEGRALYDEDWDDDRVAHELEKQNPEPDKPILSASVRAWRHKLYGKVRDYKPGGSAKVELTDRQNKLEARFENHLDEMAEWCRKVQVAHQRTGDEFEALRKKVDALHIWMERMANFLQQSRVSTYKAPDGRPISTPPDEARRADEH